VLYYKNSWGAIIKNYAEHGIIPEGSVTPDQIIWAAPIWHQMVDYRSKTDGLMKGLEGKSLSADKKALLGKAKEYYGWYDFLDAYRFATAAAG
jgi:hypothetical protein